MKIIKKVELLLRQLDFKFYIKNINCKQYVEFHFN